MDSTAGAAPPQAEPTYWQSEGTKTMALRLERIVERVEPLKNFYLNHTNAAFLERIIPLTTDPQQLFNYRIKYPLELLNAGLSEKALAEFESLETFLATNNPVFFEKNREMLTMYRAVCCLRMGEQDNCLNQHNINSCLFPIQSSGIHTVQRGSRAALPILQSVLEQHPNDLSAQWLLNIGYMTLGEYPDRVPETWRIPPQTFASEYDLGRFVDVADRLGVGIFELSGGSILEDFDNDGYLDLMVSSLGLRDQLRYFRNDGQGGLEDRTLQAGLKGLVGGLNLIQADYNNDGFVDVLVLRGAWFASEGRHPNSLLKNNGDGTFSDVTEEAGILSYHPTQTAVWFDFNGDGWLDLFIGNETTGQERHGCELFRNLRNGSFDECSGTSGVRHYGFIKAAVSADYDHDGRPDLFISCYNDANVLFHNDGPRKSGGGPDGDWKFSAVNDSVTAQPTNSFPAWFFDYDNDGWDDLFVCGYRASYVGEIAADYLGLTPKAETSRLFRNDGRGGFTDVSKQVRMDRVLHGMGSNFGDFDNDGWLDCYLGTGSPPLDMLIPNVALRNDRGQRFQDVTTSAGLGHLQKGHGVSFGDLDNDGDQDIHITMGGAYTGDIYPNALFENPGHGNHWLTLKLEGVTSNRGAIGARIHVTVTQEGQSRAIFRTVGSGGSFGCSPLRQEIGLGQATAIERVEIFWPVTGATQVLTGLAMDRFYKIKEGESAAVPWPLQTFKLTGGQHPTPHAHSHAHP